MSTGYPSSIDTTSTLKNDASDGTVTATTHAAAHDNVADSLMAIETELGTLPKGVYADVKTRLNDAIYKTPSGAQVIRPSADIVPFAVRKNTGTDISNLSEWRDHLNVIMSYMEPGGVFSAQGFRVAGTLLNSTHLSDSAQLARLASPTFTGTPAAPTPAPGDNTTKVATTAFVTAAVAAATPGAGSITESQLAKPAVGTPEVFDNAITGAKIAAGVVAQGHLAAGAAAGQSYGTAFPTTGLYNGYRFTLFVTSNYGNTPVAYDCIYRIDLDGTYPWFVVGGAPMVSTSWSGGTSSTGWVACSGGSSLVIPRSGIYRTGFGGLLSSNASSGEAPNLSINSGVGFAQGPGNGNAASASTVFTWTVGSGTGLTLYIQDSNGNSSVGMSNGFIDLMPVHLT